MPDAPAGPPTLQVDPSNVEAHRAWDGDDGDYWTERDATFDGSLRRYHDAFFAAMALTATDRVLDVGCGTGHTTRAAARRAPDGDALGVDLSARMLARARELAAAEGLANVRFLHADAQVHPFDAGAFDVAISRTGCMFFGDPVAAFANIGRALRPGGRIALLVWQAAADNEWFAELRAAVAAGRDLPEPPPDAPGPFSFADPDRVRAILTRAGFDDVVLDGRRELMGFGDDADDAFRFMAGLGFVRFVLRDVDDAARSAALAALRSSIDAHETPDGVLYPSAAWIVTARR